MAEDISELEVMKPKACFGVRHFQSLMLFTGMVLIFCMRVGMGMAIVAMTDPNKKDTFDWSLQTQSVILSSFIWGYVVLQIPGGELAARFGGMPLMISCVGVNALVALITPVCAYYGGWQLVCACRVIQGLIQGFTNPCIHNLISKWVPLSERSSLGTFIYAGSHLGTALQLLTAGFIAEEWGWPAIFYIYGSLGVIWTVIYYFLGSNSPQTSKIISVEEQMYIQKALGQKAVQKNLKTPWKSLLTSLPFYALTIAHAGAGYGYWTLLYEIPTFQHRVLGVKIKANSMMSALPYLVAYIMSFVFGFLADYTITKKWVSITTSRKICNTFGTTGPAIAMTIISFAPPSVMLTTVVLTLAFGVKAGTYSGFNLVHLDMAPNFAGTMIGITGTITNIVSLNAPLIAGSLIQNDTDQNDWRKVFLLASGIYVASNIFFLIFGTSKKQPWNEPPKETETQENQNML